MVFFFSPVPPNMAVVSPNWKMILPQGVFKCACPSDVRKRKQKEKTDALMRQKNPRLLLTKHLVLVHCSEQRGSLYLIHTSCVGASSRLRIVSNLALVE